MNFRMERIDLEIKNALSLIISQMNNKVLSGNFITIAEVKTSPDLYNSRVSISFLNDGKDNKEILKTLNESKGYIKRELARKMRIKRIPDLFFVSDKTEQGADRIEELLAQIVKQKEDKKD
ncbi:MAG: 30S ribosome-binding factor RbfA [Clostridia bacterium]|nr:30S ribosome-binding factor RbfA [Clostridia bacterium]